FSPFTALSVSTSSSNIPPMVNDGFTYADDKGVFHPLKATELPSIEKGTWKLFDDGRMETTWHLKPNIKWHDGQAETNEDYKFAFEVAHDKELPRAITAVIAAQKDLSFPDDHTVVVSWATPYVD